MIGFNVYRNGIKQNAAPQSETTYTDLLPRSVDPVRYAIRAVNAAGKESAARQVDIFNVAAGLLSNSLGSGASNPLTTRYFDAFTASITNLASTNMYLSQIELRRSIQGATTMTQTVDVASSIGVGNWLSKDITFPCSVSLTPQSVRLRAIQQSNIGAGTVIYQSTFDFTDVKQPGIMVEIIPNQLPLAGGYSSFDLKLFNRGAAEANVVVSKKQRKPARRYLYAG